MLQEQAYTNKNMFHGLLISKFLLSLQVRLDKWNTFCTETDFNR